ncbi:type II secretion system protein [Salipaludibacillus aurantiacus]|uniref:Competence protein ComGE n=1 Tax=Salipaludibacillus aurantiacus TaxID=1601833 RepID=A0A1H9PPC9_9BACI|nr:type II secretion system protein [Salipaludibacillus aurantiacus]SER49930.1 hypothetical protein SAMN05518684_101404 [Salipaludibacillus aurantiacus]
MTKSEKGFFLYETVLSLLILSIIMTAMFPVIMQVQTERMMIREQREAVTLVRKEMLKQYEAPQSGFPEKLEGEEQIYSLTVKNKGAHVQEYCLNWEGRNSRAQTYCLSLYLP